MVHLFNTGIAAITGVDGAIMMNHLFYWIQKNAANKKYFYDGKYWTYNSKEAFSKYFKYWTSKQVKRIIDNLLNDGYIVKGNYNENKLDHTIWYSFTDKGLELLKNNDYDMDSIDLTKWENRIDQTGKSIINKNKTNNNIEDKEENLISKDISQKSGKSEKELIFDEGMKKAYPRVMKMPKPLTYDQYNKLLERYPNDTIRETLEAMENYRKLDTYNSSYRTLNKWLSRN